MSFCYNSAKTELVALRLQNLKVGSKDYALVKCLASHQHGPGSRKKTQTHVIRDLLTSIFPALGTHNMFSRIGWAYTQSLVKNPAGDYMNTFQQFFLLILPDFSVRLARS